MTNLKYLHESLFEITCTSLLKDDAQLQQMRFMWIGSYVDLLASKNHYGIYPVHFIMNVIQK